MNKTAPVVKNQELELTIESLSLEGQGVARHEGFIVFVPGALPGEAVTAHVIKVTASYAVAKLIAVLTPSPDRVAPLCPQAASCGGCALQHLSYAAQLKVKEQAVLDALTRLGGFTDVSIRPIIGMENPWHYRNKGSFPMGQGRGGVVYGFFAERSHRIVPIIDCPIQSEKAMDVIRRVSEWANTFGVPAYDEESGRGVLRHMMVRVTTGGSVMAVLVTATDRIKHKDDLLELLSDVDSVYHNCNPDRTNVIFGKAFTLLAGAPAIEETLLGLNFTVSPQSFLQVNPVQTERLYGAAVDFLAPTDQETVVDAYCGIGTISLLLAKRAKAVLGIEFVSEAIENARENARLNGISNASFYCGDAAKLLTKLASEQALDALVTDPPRKGMEPEMIDAILKTNIRRLVYVSCAPATLARDCKLLAAGGFQLKSVQPVDMFPHTGHVETVVLMSKDR